MSALRSNTARRTSLRTLFLALFAFLAMTAVSSALTITIKTGQRGNGCRGFGICSITVDFSSSALIRTNATLDGNKLRLEFSKRPNEAGAVLPVTEPIALDPAIARGLGASSVTILPGQYEVDYSTNPNGVVVVDVQASAIVIHVQLGRYSRGCAGFGICRIWLDAASATTDMVGTLDGNTLSLDFVSGPPQSGGEPFVIDEDIVLDEATSLKFGAKKLVIKKGTYVVDYSTNPNGSVALAVDRIGIKIHIEIGRRSKNCEGVGICWTTIEATTMNRPVPAVATLEENMLTLDFMKTLPEQGDTMFVDEDVVLDKQTALALGAQELVIAKGAYKISRLGGPLGSIAVPVLRRGVTITIEAGRQSKGCTGFGICSITIELRLFNRPIPAVGSFYGDGDVLSLDFTSKHPEAGDVLVIDEDIVLDDATARALGASKVVVKKGSYHVDYTKNPNGSVNLQTSRVGIKIHVEPGRRSKGCEGFGICSIDIIIELMVNPTPTVATLTANTLTLDFMSKLPEDGTAFTIDEDIVLSPATARMLGADQVRILKGTYQVDYSKNPNGTVELPVARFGIVIHVEIGRPSRGCRGFGICSIDISGSAMTERGASAVGSLSGNMLTLDFTSKLAEQGDELVIEEDLMLSDDVARKLGAKQVRIAKGTYRVDYSKNPNGTVELPVARFGITIHVEVGRRSKGCTGFGVCSIDIEINLRSNGVPTVASLDGDSLRLSFASPTGHKEDVFVVEEDMVLTGDVAKALGAKEVTIKRGAYMVDYSNNPNGDVVVPVQRLGIGVTIKWGHPRFGCQPGWGICWISIDMDLAKGGRPAVAVIKNGKLEISLDTHLESDSSHVVIQDPLSLDAQTAAALGVRSLTVMPGTYEIDRSEDSAGAMMMAASVDAQSSVGNSANLSGSRSTTVTPNPASANMTIGFSLTKSSPVTMTIVDARGQVVAEPLDGTMMESGDQQVPFDASTLPTGIYHYRIVTSNGVQSGSFVVTR